ncbi:MAG: peptidoglycan D,D-transpeptidase FtsI family protein [Sciscionella sp.]
MPAPHGRARLGTARGRARAGGTGKRTHPRRIKIGKVLLVGALGLAALRLVQVQALPSVTLASHAEAERLTKIQIPADRGTITDRDGTKLAFSVDSRALAVIPSLLRKDYAKKQALAAKQHKRIPDYNSYTKAMVDYLHTMLGKAIDPSTVLPLLRSDTNYHYLDKQVEPTVANKIVARYPDLNMEHRAVREYPDGSVGSNILGVANWRANSKVIAGLAGLESSMNSQLAGTSGSETVDTPQGNNSVAIPGTERNVKPAVGGEDVALTIDSDLQYQVQRLLTAYCANPNVRAKSGSAAVLDARTGQVLALANNANFNPNDLSNLDPKMLADPAVSDAFEPGSVGKMITAAAAIQAGVVKPDSVISVPGHIKVADRVIHDDWWHPTQNFTFTGILAKSSNVGIDEVAQKVGPKRFDDVLKKFGIGARTGIGLPGESAGYVPPMKDWSGSTFGNLPFGQGYSMTVLQMASAYQAIANGGVRIPPRIIASTTGPHGTVHRTPQPAGVRVVDPQSAATVVSMLRSVTQDQPSPNRGTAPSAAIPGYQIAGKTGTAQQYDPKLGHYSSSKYWTTFAGIFPADHPRYVVAIMLNQPAPGLQGGETAAPLFHDVASYLAQRNDIPLSNGPTPIKKFVLN